MLKIIEPLTVTFYLETEKRLQNYWGDLWVVTGYIYKCELAHAPFQLYQKHFVKKRKAAFIFNHARGGQELWIACLLWKLTVIQKILCFWKRSLAKTRRVALSDCDTSNESYSTLKRTSLFSQGQVKAREILHLWGKCRPIHCALS